jgi:deoxyribodipyrimidine photolyase-related protein
MRQLILILGDQLSLDNPALDHFDPNQDRLLMIEAKEESTHVWSHKARIVLFLSSMRHFAQHLRHVYGDCLIYDALENHHHTSVAAALVDHIRLHQPEGVVCQAAGDWRLQQSLQAACESCQTPLQWTGDRHFLCTLDDFSRWAKGKKQLRMEFFYRWLRAKLTVLMQGAEPEGGQWNYDTDNRHPIPKAGLGWVPEPIKFVPDEITKQVIQMVEQVFADHPGNLAHFAWAVTAEQAELALNDFVTHRLSTFGVYEDAMWRGEPYLYHSLLSSAMNLQLLHPMQVIAAVLSAYRAGKAPLNSVEGFIRQVLGWREFMRGIYWQTMPSLADANHFGHHRALPTWFWTGETDKACLRHVITQTLETGYAHHIQRLMVVGLYATLAELKPQSVSDWFHAIYVDATDWVQRPNVMGMALFANGGLFTSKPYIASGAYIHKMSNYCQDCRFKPSEKVGAHACPFTQLYWRFLIQHQDELAANPRTALMTTHVKKLSDTAKAAIVSQAEAYLLTQG